MLLWKVPLLPSILSSLSALIFSLQSSIKPIIPNIEPVIVLFRTPSPPVPSLRQSLSVCEDASHAGVYRSHTRILFSSLFTECDKSSELWKKTLLNTLSSISHAFAEITGTMNPSIDATPRLPLPPLVSFGRLTPSVALNRLAALLHLLQNLLRFPPAVTAFPVLRVVATLQQLLEVFVPPARRGEEASATGVSLSPRDQWLLWPLVYPLACEAGISAG